MATTASACGARCSATSTWTGPSGGASEYGAPFQEYLTARRVGRGLGRAPASTAARAPASRSRC